MGIVNQVLAQGIGNNFNNISLGFYRGGTWQSLVGTITTWVLIIAAVIAFFYLIISGFTYLTAGGNPDAAKKGQQGIINAVIGVIIIFLAFAIIRAVTNFTNSSTGVNQVCPAGQTWSATTNQCQ